MNPPPSMPTSISTKKERLDRTSYATLKLTCCLLCALVHHGQVHAGVEEVVPEAVSPAHAQDLLPPVEVVALLAHPVQLVVIRQ